MCDNMYKVEESFAIAYFSLGQNNTGGTMLYVQLWVGGFVASLRRELFMVLQVI